jgi:GntR family transcriptional repressor for pyruvate dehydrogenase complex
MNRMKTSDVLVNVTRVEQIATTLRTDIVSGRSPPGQRLQSIEELAERFTASRAAVREALRGLSERRLVDIRHGDGTYARAPRVEDVAEAMGLLLHFSAGDQTTLLLALLEIRAVLEPAATRLAAERATPADLGRLSELMEKGIAAAAAGDHEAAVELDMEFHTAIGRASHNPILSMIIEVITPVRKEMRQALLKLHNRQRMTLRAHRAIVRAIADRRPDDAEREATRHLGEINALMKKHFMHLGG